MKRIKILLIVLIIILAGLFISGKTYAAELVVRTLGAQRERPFTEPNPTYKFRSGTNGEDVVYTVVKIYDDKDRNEQQSLLYSKALYCLRGGKGFGANDETDISKEPIEYTEIGEMHTDAAKIIEQYKNYYDINLDRTETINEEKIGIQNKEVNIYNAILWILDESYIPLNSENYNEEEYKTELLTKAEIPEVQQKDITKDDIEVIQQLAIWYFANYDEQQGGNEQSVSKKGIMNPSNFISINENNNIEPKERSENLDKIYQYLIKGAIENSLTYQGTETRTKNKEKNEFDKKTNLKKENIDIQEENPDIFKQQNHYYKIGPFSIKNDMGERVGGTTLSLDSIEIFDAKGTKVKRVYDMPMGGKNDVYIFINPNGEKVEEIEKGVEYYIKFYKIFAEGYEEGEEYPVDKYDMSNVTLKINTTYMENTATFLVREKEDQPIVEIKKKKIDEFDKLTTESPKEFDLSLRKFITSIKRGDESIEVESRVPQINTNTLINGVENREGTKEYTATYTHPKNALEVKTGDIVKYTIRVYNEGEVDAKATEITDYLPSGLELVPKEQSTINEKYKWTESEDADGMKVVKSTYLNDAVIKAFDQNAEKGEELEEGKVKWQKASEGSGGLYYADLQIECVVIANASDKDQNLRNIAAITQDKDAKNQDINDRDSEPGQPDLNNYNPTPGNNTNSTYQQDDDDYEPLVLEAVTKVVVTKKWSDDDNRDRKRPEKVTVQLYKKEKGQEQATPMEGFTAELKQDNDWTHTFDNLPKYKEGEEIEYTVKETDLPDTYSASIVKNSEITEYTSYTITNTHVPETTKVIVTKVWKGDSDKTAERPEGIEVQLYKTVKEVEEPVSGEEYKVTLNSSKDWTHTFDNLPKYENGEEIKYTVKEVTKLQKYSTEITQNESNDTKFSFTITNTYIPSKIQIPVEKIWNDQNDNDKLRPESITVELYKNNEATENTLELNESNSWKNTFTDLVEEDETGATINYDVREVKVPEGYTSETTGSIKEGYKITNTHTPLTTKIEVTKVWNDGNNQDGARPESIVVQLYRTDNGENVGEAVTLNSDNGWTHTFENLPKNNNGVEIEYKVKEVNVPEGYTSVITGSMLEGYTITNNYTPETTKVIVTKEWVDGNNQDGTRPESIVVQLYRTDNSENIGEAVTLNSNNGWTHTFENLAKKENGTEIPYAVKEVEIPQGYTSAIKGSISEGYTITNSYSPETTKVVVTKEWEDSNNKDGIRPESIKVQLYRTDNNANIGEAVTLNEANSWTYTFENLAKKENGTEIPYAVKEVEIPEGYTNETTGNLTEGYKIINKHTPKEFDLSLRKFITSIKRNGKEVEFEDRTPKIDTTTLINGTYNRDGELEKTATYEHTKEPLVVKKGDVITYTLRIYNEGQEDGYAEEITDYIPEGLALILNHKTTINNMWKLTEEINSDKTMALVGENGFYKTEEEVKNLNIKDFEGITDLKEAKLVSGKVKITTNLLNSELIKAFDKEKTETEEGWQKAEKGEGGLYYKDIQIPCLVVADNTYKETITNIAEITEDKDENKKEVNDEDSTPNDKKDPYSKQQEDDDDYEPVVLRYFDLALRKFITEVDTNGEKKEITTRIPNPKMGEDGNIKYEHSKEPVEVGTNDIVTYTIRVYNEGTTAGYAEEITDDIPEGLLYLPEHSTNREYEWVMIDKEGNETENPEEAEKIKTEYLSEKKEGEERKNQIQAFDNSKAISIEEPYNPDYKEVKIAFKVQEPKETDRIITNSAQITKDSNEDEDSTPNEWNEGEDDQDQEHIYVKYFDLSLLKWVTKTIVTVDGKTTTTETGYKPNTGKTETTGIRDNKAGEPIAKVEIDRKKLNSTTVKFGYKIRVTNEGEIAGYATEITDYIPEGLEFKEEDNKAYGWTKEGDNKVTTRALETVLLQPGESAEVEIIFTWKNNTNNLGVKTNIAEITEDYNEHSTKDIDSTPNNKKEPYEAEQEDDDDFALVILSIRTGKAISYALFITTITTMLAGGIYLVKRYVLTY